MLYGFIESTVKNSIVLSGSLFLVVKTSTVVM